MDGIANHDGTLAVDRKMFLVATRVNDGVEEGRSRVKRVPRRVFHSQASRWSIVLEVSSKFHFLTCS